MADGKNLSGESRIAPIVKFKISSTEHDEHILDAGDADELLIMKRYDQMFKALVKKRGYAMNGECGQGTAIDWAVCYALQGGEYINEIMNILNYTVLHAALLLTITLPAYIDPPDFRSSNMSHLFMALAGISSMTNLLSILSATVFVSVLGRPYGNVDTFMARLDDTLFAVAIAFDYIGVLTLLAATLVAGFNRTYLDGYMQLYSIAIVLFIIVAWIYTALRGNTAQLERVMAFKTRYCDADGQLKDECLNIIYPPQDLPSLLRGVDCEDLLGLFESAGLGPMDSPLETVLMMTREDLEELGVRDMKARLKLLAEFHRIKES